MWSYRDPVDDGLWGKPTATIDWCEENYVVSDYFAEIVNATSNTIFLFIAYKMFQWARVDRHDTIFQVVSVGMGMVGAGSWLFHMTLKYDFQLLDELPMVYFTGFSLAYLLAIELPQKARYAAYATAVALMTLFTYLYCNVYHNPVFQEVVFGAITLSLISRSVWTVRQYVHDDGQRFLAYEIMVLGIVEFLLGFVFWNLDTRFCSRWISWRRSVGLPLGLLLEGHGWWHFLTALGISHFIIYFELLNTWYNSVPERYTLRTVCGVPYRVELTTPMEESDKRPQSQYPWKKAAGTSKTDEADEADKPDEADKTDSCTASGASTTDN